MLDIYKPYIGILYANDKKVINGRSIIMSQKGLHNHLFHSGIALLGKDQWLSIISYISRYLDGSVAERCDRNRASLMSSHSGHGALLLCV